jgi:hypothetical protein
MASYTNWKTVTGSFEFDRTSVPFQTNVAVETAMSSREVWMCPRPIATRLLVRTIGMTTVIASALAAVTLPADRRAHAQSRQIAVLADANLPDEVASVDGIVRALTAAFDQVDIVALGEDHGRRVDSDLRIALVRHPDFAKKVRTIVVEFGSAPQQSLLDRYVRGENVSAAELRQVWTTTSAGPRLDSPMFADFFAAVREVNATLPAGAQVRVFGGDPGPTTARSRDGAAVDILKAQVFQKHGKALLVYGAAHFFRTQGDASDFLAADGGGIIQTLEVDYPGRSLVVIPIGGPSNAPEIVGSDLADYGKFDRALKTPIRPVLVSLKRPPFRDFTAEEFIGRKLLTCRGAGGCVSVFKGSTLSIGQLADVAVYFGKSSTVDTKRPQ